MKKKNKRKAQQLIEFLLIAPFLIMLLGLLTEYAYALNVNMTLAQGVKMATSSIYKKIKPNMSASDIRNEALADLTDYMKSNNVPAASYENVTLAYTKVDSTTIFIATCPYYSAFTLPNVFFSLIPTQFNFTASASIPTAFLSSNSGYNSGISSTDLDKVWSGSNFSGLDTYDGVRNGIMKDTEGRDKLLFLVPIIAPSITNAHILTLWGGDHITDGTYNYVLSSTDKNLYKCSDTECILEQKFSNYLSGTSYTNIIFSPDGLGAWLVPAGSSDISPKTVDGILKRSIALINTSSKSIGNYDNIDVSSYNTDASTSNLYTVATSGDKIVVYKTSQEFSCINE